MANPPTSLPAIPATPVPIPGTPGPAHVPASGAGSPPAANGVAHATNAPPPPAPMELDPVALMVRDFWATNHDKIDQGDVDFKYHPLPLARIKKVMKSDPDIKQMISSEAPLVFSKACELFIAELTLRAWMVAEENKRRTLQRGDIMAAVSKSDQYDFLIDIIPREDPDAIPRKRYTKDSQNNQQHPSSIPGMLYDPSAAGSAPPGFPMMGHMPYAPMQFGAGGPYMDPNAAAAAAAAMVMPPQFAHFHPGAPGMPVQPSLPPGFLPQYPMQQGFLPSQHQHQQQPQPQSQQHQQPMNMFAPNQMQHQHLQQQPPPPPQQGGGPPRSILSPPPNASQPHSIPMVSPPPGQMHFTHSATPPTPGSAKHPSGTHPLYSPPATSMSMQPLPGSASSTHSQFTTPPTSATYPIGQPLMHRPATSTSGEPTPQSATFATSVMGLDHAQFQQQQGGAQSVGATPVQTPHSATFGGAQFAAAQQQQQQMQHQQQQHQHQHQQQQQHQHQQGLAAMLGAMGGQQQQMQMQSGSGNVAADGTGGVS